MKILITGLMLLVAVQTASANCKNEVEERLEKSLSAIGHDYHGLEQKFGRELIETIRQSDELSSERKSEIGSLLQTAKFEFYVLTAAQGPGGYQDLLAVSKNSCATYRRYRIYNE